MGFLGFLAFAFGLLALGGGAAVVIVTTTALVEKITGRNIISKAGGAWGRLSKKLFGTKGAWFGDILLWFAGATGVTLWYLPAWQEAFWTEQLEKQDEKFDALSEQFDFNPYSSQFLAWYPGSREWYESQPGGNLYNSTDIIPPWDIAVGNTKDDLDFTGFYNSTYFDNVIPTWSDQDFPGNVDYFDMFGAATDRPKTSTKHSVTTSREYRRINVDKEVYENWSQEYKDQLLEPTRGASRQRRTGYGGSGRGTVIKIPTINVWVPTDIDPF